VSHYRNGREFEYKVRDELTTNGYEVIRAAGSKGKVDLVAFKQWPTMDAWKRWHMLFVQAKRRDGNIGPDDRAELVRLANIANAIPLVAHQSIPRRPIQYRRLTGPGPKDWQPWTPDEVAP
jgi:Holliday junction resolvase